MRKFIAVAAAIAAFSCGGTSTSLSKDEAESVATEISAALETRTESGAKLLTFGGSSTVTANCAGGGTLTVKASISVNCPWGYLSCKSTGSLSLAAAACTTSGGVIIDGTLTGTTTSSGISFTTTVTGTLTITRPGEVASSCTVNLTWSSGHLSGTVCGTSVSK